MIGCFSERFSHGVFLLVINDWLVLISGWLLFFSTLATSDQFFLLLWSVVGFLSEFMVGSDWFSLAINDHWLVAFPSGSLTSCFVIVSD